MSSTPLSSPSNISRRWLDVIVHQAKAGSTEAFETLFDAAQDGDMHARRALLKLVLHHQFAPARSSEALRVVRELDPSSYPTPDMKTMYLSLRCLAIELHENPSILRDITEPSIWDCIWPWAQFFLEDVGEAEPCIGDTWNFQDKISKILVLFVSGIMKRGYDVRISHDILRSAARLWLFAARKAVCPLLCELAYSLGFQRPVQGSPHSSVTKIVIDVFADPPNANLFVKTLYRLLLESPFCPVKHDSENNKRVDSATSKKEIHVIPIHSTLRLVVWLIGPDTTDRRAFEGLCNAGLFPCLIFILRRLFHVGGTRRRTPDDPALAEKCAEMILTIFYVATQPRTVRYILQLLEPKDVLAVLMMFAHRLQTVPPSDQYLSRNWERLLLSIFTNLTVACSFYHSVGSMTRRLLRGAKIKKAEVAVGQAGGAIWEKFVTLKTMMERVRTRHNEFRNTHWPLCCSETVGYLLFCDFLGLLLLLQCRTATEVSALVKSCKPCGGCMITFYCSRECQKADWKARHKELCKRQPIYSCSMRDQSYAVWQVNVDFQLAWVEHTKALRETAHSLGQKPSYKAVMVRLDYRSAPPLMQINEGLRRPVSPLPHPKIPNTAAGLVSEDDLEWMWSRCSCQATFPDYGLAYDADKGWLTTAW